MAKRAGPISVVTATLIYLTTLAFCSIGAVGVLVVVGLLILVDVFVGLAKGDFKTRMQRPRW